MQHSLAPGRSRLMPRFVAPSIHGREARLGLHHMAPGMVTGAAAPSRGARMGLRDRAWDDDRTGPAARVRAASPRAVLHWTSDAGEHRSAGTSSPRAVAALRPEATGARRAARAMSAGGLVIRTAGPEPEFVVGRRSRAG